MKKFLSILFLTAAFISCQNNSYTINGKFSDYNGTVYMYNATGIIDSVMTTDGSFTFKGNVSVPDAMYIGDNPEYGGRICFFILEPGKLEMNEMIDYETYIMHGTKTNELMSRMAHKSVELTKYYEENESVEGIADKVNDEFRTFLKQELQDNRDNLYGVICLSEYLDYLTDDQVTKYLSGFSSDLKKTRVWKKIYNEQKAKKKSDAPGIGESLKDFTQDNINGGKITASQVMNEPGTKYLLIDFWASWCGPCMGEVPYLKEAYAKYSGKGFQILGVSLDQDGDSWRAAVKNNDMNWLHVSDLQYWNNAAARLYNINSIPANFLYDCSTGKVIASNLRGKNLESTLSELLK